MEDLELDLQANKKLEGFLRLVMTLPSITIMNWRWLHCYTARIHDYFELELSGAWEPQTIRKLKCLINVKLPTIMLLMKTKCSISKIKTISSKLGFLNYFTIDIVGQKGGLAMMWKDDVNLEILNYSRRHINTKVKEADSGLEWGWTGFYGEPRPIGDPFLGLS